MKIKRRDILYAILFVAWIPAHILYGWLPNAAQVMLVIRFMVNILVLISIRKSASVVKGRHFLLLYIVSVIISTILKRGLDVNSLFKMAEYILFIWVVISWMAQMTERKWISFIKSARTVGIFYLIGSVLFNIHFLMTTPELGYQGTYFFLGSRAESVQTEVMLLVIMVAYNLFVSKNNLELYIEMGTALLDAILFSSGQGITMIGLLAITWVLFQKDKLRVVKFFTPFKMSVIVAVLNVLVLTGVYQSIELVVYYITSILNKSLSLTGRTIIFSTAIKLITQSPIWGYGYNNMIMYNTIGYINPAFVSAHNSILDIALNTGIPSAIFICLYVFQTVSYHFERHCIEQDRMSLILYISIWSYFIGGLVNLSVGSRYFWMVLAIAGGYAKHSDTVNKRTIV